MRLGALLWLMSALPAVAEQVDCAKAQTQVEVTFCAEQDWMAADKALNDAYAGARAFQRQIDAGLSQDQRGAEASLKQAQRAWVSYRDAFCDAVGYQMSGGSAQGMLIYQCLARLTRAQTAELQGFATE